MEIIEVPIELEHISSQELIACCRIVNGKLIYKMAKKPAKDLRVALVSNWKQACGISTYAQHLFPELVQHVGEYKLFVEYTTNPTGNINQVGDQVVPDNVMMCWKRGEPLQELVQAIKDYEPDLVLINHEFGLWSNACHWLSMMTELSDYRVIVVMHSVFPDHYDKMIYEASMPELIVHLELAQYNLKQIKQVNARVHLIPHGCYPIGDQRQLWNNYKSQHTFVQQGFGFGYKNFAASIRTIALLRDKYPDVFFTGLISESPHNKAAHQIYYNELVQLSRELGVQGHVALVRGFQPDNIIDSYLRSNQIAVFPYLSVPGHEVYGASGAARVAMSAGIPVISSSIPHFSDTPTIKANGPEQMAAELDRLFCSPELRQQQISKQNEFVIANSWANIAQRYISVFENNQ